MRWRSLRYSVASDPVFPGRSKTILVLPPSRTDCQRSRPAPQEGDHSQSATRADLDGSSASVHDLRSLIFEDHGAIVREVPSKTDAVANHRDRVSGLKSRITDPRESVGALYMRDLKVD